MPQNLEWMETFGMHKANVRDKTSNELEEKQNQKKQARNQTFYEFR